VSGIEEDFPVLAGIAVSGRSFGREAKLEARRALAELQALRSDVANLLTWKMEASLVLEDWEKVWEAAGRPGPLGASKAANVLSAVRTLKAQLDVQRRIPR
jgi:hypothetical protein